jgi:hypothetical protein
MVKLRIHCKDMSPHKPHAWGGGAEDYCPGTPADPPSDLELLRDSLLQEVSYVDHGALGAATLLRYSQDITVITQKASGWADVVVMDPELRKMIKDLARRALRVKERVELLRNPS